MHRFELVKKYGLSLGATISLASMLFIYRCFFVRWVPLDGFVGKEIDLTAKRTMISLASQMPGDLISERWCQETGIWRKDLSPSSTALIKGKEIFQVNGTNLFRNGNNVLRAGSNFVDVVNCLGYPDRMITCANGAQLVYHVTGPNDREFALIIESSGKNAARLSAVSFSLLQKRDFLILYPQKFLQIGGG